MGKKTRRGIYMDDDIWKDISLLAHLKTRMGGQHVSAAELINEAVSMYLKQYDLAIEMNKAIEPKKQNSKKSNSGGK